jgi:hypothetical protein
MTTRKTAGRMDRRCGPRGGQIEDWEFTSTCANPAIQRLSVRTPVEHAPFCRGVTKTPEAARTDTDRITPPEANDNKTNVVCAGGTFADDHAVGMVSE